MQRKYAKIRSFMSRRHLCLTVATPTKKLRFDTLRAKLHKEKTDIPVATEKFEEAQAELDRAQEVLPPQKRKWERELQNSNTR